MTITEIFERFGEAHFRDGERRVIARLIDEYAQGDRHRRRRLRINDETRALILDQALAIWLDARTPAVLADRVGRRDTGPAAQPRPREVLDELAKVRNPSTRSPRSVWRAITRRTKRP